jgi:hypothetical protein
MYLSGIIVGHQGSSGCTYGVLDLSTRFSTKQDTFQFYVFANIIFIATAARKIIAFVMNFYIDLLTLQVCVLFIIIRTWNLTASCALVFREFRNL